MYLFHSVLTRRSSVVSGFKQGSIRESIRADDVFFGDWVLEDLADQVFEGIMLSVSAICWKMS
jgi:hypothetical protein